MRAFCHDLANCIPDFIRVNRGKMSLDGVAEKAVEFDTDRVVVVERARGEPGRISLFKLSLAGLKLVPPLILISGIRLRRETREKTKRIRTSVITVEPKDSSELERICAVLSKYLGLPLFSLDTASKNQGSSLHLSLNYSRQIQITFVLLDRMVELGPRITISRLVWEVPS